MRTFTPRMKTAPVAWNAPRLEIFHPRTVHIFSRVLRAQFFAIFASLTPSPASVPVPEIMALLHNGASFFTPDENGAPARVNSRGPGARASSS